MIKGSWQANPMRYSNYLDDPVDISLRIFALASGFDLDIEGEGAYSRTRCDRTIDTLREANANLWEKARDIVSRAKERKDYSDEDWKAFLIKLAIEGNKTFKTVFNDPNVRKRLNHLLNLSQQTRINVIAENFTVPWELLYSDDVDEERLWKLSEKKLMSGFWGLKYDISRMINQSDRPASEVSNVIFVNSRPSLGLVTDNQLHHVAKKEIPFFETLRERGKIDLFPMPELDPTLSNKRDEFKKFESFWDDEFNITHFACHASYEKNPQIDSSIRITNGFCVELFDLVNAEISLKDYPLVVLNACEMGQIDPLDSWYFAKEFIRKGARGVIAAECPVPDIFAAQFTKELYKYLLKGKFVGESMLLARRNLMHRNNPVGLLYSVYAPRNIRLKYKRPTRTH